jgi:hypothetical protein
MTEPSGSLGQRTFAATAAVLLVCFFAVQCGQSPTGPTPSPAPTPTVPDPNTGPVIPFPTGPVLFSGAGDIGSCDSGNGTEITARLLENLGGRIFTTGDNAYPFGEATNFQRCYDLSWGRFKDRTYPVPGNHDYGDDQRSEANAYFSYFGSNAGAFGAGYYSYDYGSWHIIALNSNFKGPAHVGVAVGSPQMSWLVNDLQVNHPRCVLAYWHHPLFSSGQNGPSPDMHPIFKALYDANADVVLNGHDHIYERFGPQDADGRRDEARGIREFIVGTGGHQQLTAAPTATTNSDRKITGQFGILRLTLNTDSYAWEFVTGNGSVQDSGSGTCH